MGQFSKSLDLLIRGMEQGRNVKLESGHTLTWNEEHQGPGYLATRTIGDKVDEIVFQINSEVAWMSLIEHARKMTEQDFLILGANMALTEINRNRRG